MNGVDEMVRAALREQADAQAPAAPLLANRVLTAHRRRVRRRIGGIAAVTAAVVGLAFWAPLPDGGTEAPVGGGAPSVVARTDQSPPREVIAAGDVVMAAYTVTRTVKSRSGDTGERRRTYWLLDPESQTYEKDERWSVVAVAPGARKAAVLERKLPVRRIGVLDLRSREVERWIELDGDDRQRVAGLAWSRDGGSLLATTYSDNPDRLVTWPGTELGAETAGGTAGEAEELEPPRDSDRTGFWVVDVASGTGRWSEVGPPSGAEEGMLVINARQDFEFTRDGRAVRGGRVSGERSEFHDLRGDAIDPPDGEAHWEWSVAAAGSPDGTRMAGPFAGVKRKTSSWILDARTGKPLAEIPGQQLLAWAGKDTLVAWDVGRRSDSEYANRLVLVTIGSEKTVPLSGFRGDSDQDSGRWDPLFVRR